MLREGLIKCVEARIAETLSGEFSLKALDGLRSFAARTRYCGQHLNRMASGSGRIVYDMGDGTVLKLAKNPKGVAQNNVESEPFMQQYDVVAKVTESSAQDTWLVAQKAEKMTTAKFKAINGYTFKVFKECLWAYHQQSKGKNTPWPSEYLEVSEDEFYQEITDLMGNYDMPYGDLARPSTYGVVGNKVVLTDYGLTSYVYEEHYAPKKKPSHGYGY